MIRIRIVILLAAALLLPTAVHAQQFDGVYVGVQAGYGRLKASVGGFSVTDDTAVIGAFVGYRAKTSPSGSLVLGVEIDGNYITNDSDLFLGASGIAGYMTNPTSMIYARAGYARWENEFIDLDGWMTGVGYEHFFSGTNSFRLDYRYIDFENFLGVNPTAHAITVGLILDW